MAQIKPFMAVRPVEKFAGRVAALPYDVYNRQEAKAEVEREPLSFLKIDRAETQFPDEVDTYDDRVYQKAADMLAAEGISAEVINICTIKPLDEELIVASAKKTGKVVTAEEHSVIGGLGSAVCDAL